QLPIPAFVCKSLNQSKPTRYSLPCLPVNKSSPRPACGARQSRLTPFLVNFAPRLCNGLLAASPLQHFYASSSIQALYFQELTHSFVPRGDLKSFLFNCFRTLFVLTEGVTSPAFKKISRNSLQPGLNLDRHLHQMRA